MEDRLKFAFTDRDRISGLLWLKAFLLIAGNCISYTVRLMWLSACVCP
jgi:hypothetical protein